MLRSVLVGCCHFLKAFATSATRAKLTCRSKIFVHRPFGRVRALFLVTILFWKGLCSLSWALITSLELFIGYSCDWLGYKQLWWWVMINNGGYSHHFWQIQSQTYHSVEDLDLVDSPCYNWHRSCDVGGWKTTFVSKLVIVKVWVSGRERT